MTHPNETEAMSRSKQIRRRMQFKSTPKMRFLVRIKIIKYGVQTEKQTNRFDTVVYHTQETFVKINRKLIFMYCRKPLDQEQRNATTGNNPKAGRLPTTGSGNDTNPTSNLCIKNHLRRIERTREKERGGNVIPFIRMTSTEFRLQTTAQKCLMYL